MSTERVETPDSSNLKSYAYSPSRSVLIVEFKNGVTWEYENVPPKIFDEMKQAASPGSFLHSRVKGYYDGKKIEA